MKKRDAVLGVAVLSVLAGLLAVGYAQNQNPDEPDPFADTFEKIQQDIRARMDEYPPRSRNPEDPVDFEDAQSLRNALIERVENAYLHNSLIVLRRMAGTDTGDAVSLRRRLLDRIEDAYGRDDLPLLARMELEERTKVLLDAMRYLKRRPEQSNEPLQIIPWFAPLDPDAPTSVSAALQDGKGRGKCTQNSDCSPSYKCGQDGKCVKKRKAPPPRRDPRPRPDLSDIPTIGNPGGVRCKPPGSGTFEFCNQTRNDITEVGHEQDRSRPCRSGCRSSTAPLRHGNSSPGSTPSQTTSTSPGQPRVGEGGALRAWPVAY